MGLPGADGGRLGRADAGVHCAGRDCSVATIVRAQPFSRGAESAGGGYLGVRESRKALASCLMRAAQSGSETGASSARLK
jgi:hypothetical protein